MALSESERMIYELSARINSFEKAMIDAAGSADRAALRVEKRFEAMNRKVTQDFNNFGNTVRTTLAAVGVGLIARDVTQLADTWTTVGNRLAFAGVQAERLATVQQVVADIASRTHSDLDATADLFARMYRSSEDLGASLTQVAAVTEIVSKALAGAAQSERMGAIRQLGQGLGSGRLQGDELRSILENSRPIAEAIAAEFETTVGNLRKLGQEGKLESRRVFEAILSAGDDIDAAFQRTTFTVADAFSRLRTEAARFVGTNAQTSASVKTLTKLIEFLANNFETLASAAIIAATVIGGALAGQAVARATTALSQLTVTAAGTRAALAFLGGPLGVGLTILGAGLAYVATQTDVLTSRQELLQRSSDSAYSALQKVASLQEDLQTLADRGEDVADANSDIARTGRDARDALEQMRGGSRGVSEALSVQARISSALATIERQRTLDTLKGALADAVAAEAAERRARVLEDIFDRMREQRGGDEATEVFGGGGSGNGSGPTARERELSNTTEMFRDLIRSIEGINTRTWEELFELQENGARATAQTAASNQRSREELQRQHELTLAQLTHNAARVRALQDAEAVLERTNRYEATGLALAEARAQAEREVLAERQATNAEADRAYTIALLQDGIEIARARHQHDIVAEISDQVEVLRRARDLVDQRAMSENEAVLAATEFVAEMRAAIDADLAYQLEKRDLENQLEQARAIGDTRAEQAIRRRLEIEDQIAELRRMGLSEEAATERARNELDALERADMQGKFRDWFRGGVRSALDGEGDYFENWVRERFSAGLDEALNRVADVLFDALQPVWERITGGASDAFTNAIASALGQETTGSLAKLATDAAAAGDALSTTLVEAAARAAAQGGVNVAKETAQTTARLSISAKLMTAEIGLANAAGAAAAALAAVAASGGGKSASSALSFIGDALSFLGGFGGGAHSFGGFRAGGGGVQAGKAYIVGEKRPEVFVPGSNGFVFPDPSRMGGGGPIMITLQDNRRFEFNGASDELRNEVLGMFEQDNRTRGAQIEVQVNDAISRRNVGRN